MKDYQIGIIMGFFGSLVTNILSIIHVVGFEEKGVNFDGDSYYGWNTYIMKDGTATETRRWSSSVETFEKLKKIRIR